MARPKLWLLESGGYSYRIDFHFVDRAGQSLRSKTWHVHHAQHEPPKALLLQARAKLGAGGPRLEEIAANYVRLTTEVASIEGELATAAFTGYQPAAVNQQIGAFPLSLGVVLTSDSVHFSLFVANPRKHE